MQFISSLILATLILAASPVRAASPLTSADEVCPPDADPCEVATAIRIAGTLDFGDRKFRVLNGGQIEVEFQTFAEIRCGSFEADSDGVPIRLNVSRDNTGPAFTGGRLQISAVGQCNGQPERACHRDSECSAGSCVNNECSGLSGSTCITSNDCRALDSHCVGDPAGIRIRGDINGNGDGRASQSDGGQITLTSLGPVALDSNLHFNGKNGGGGGDVKIRSGGSFTAHGRITARGPSGEDAFAGSINVRVADDVTITSDVDLRAAQGQGEFEILAGGSVFISGDILVPGAGTGDGGEILIEAGGSIAFAGGTERRPQLLNVDGGAPSPLDPGYTGYAGEISLTAGGDVSIPPLTRLNLRSGKGTFSDSGYFEVYCGGVFLNAGVVDVRARGSQGILNGLFVRAAEIVLAENSLMRAAGGVSGSFVELRATGDISIAGILDLSSEFGATPEYAYLESGGTLSVTGEILRGGQDLVPNDTGIVLQACAIRLGEEAKIQNRGDHETILFRSGCSMEAALGSTVLGASNGSVRIVRSPLGAAPELYGTISPAPAFEFDCEPTVCACSARGGPEEPQEPCDDGLFCNGMETCAPETGCEAGTAPADDSIACTHDTCDEVTASVLHIADHSLCDDGQPCTENFCSLLDGCRSAVTCASSSTTTSTSIVSTTSTTTTTTTIETPLCGDADGNGRLSASDALSLLRIAVGQPAVIGPLEPCPLERCDVDGSGRVTASDALTILRYVVGVSVRLNCPLVGDERSGEEN
ncbi:MAG: hypothetical protein ACI8TX_003046 [Hyphomicrobiaceae bacterium]